MKKVLVVLGLVVIFAGTADASIGQSLGHAWTFVTTPINCAAELVSNIVSTGVKFVVCVLSNLNPSNIVP